MTMENKNPDINLSENLWTLLPKHIQIIFPIFPDLFLHLCNGPQEILLFYDGSVIPNGKVSCFSTRSSNLSSRKSFHLFHQPIDLNTLLKFHIPAMNLKNLFNSFFIGCINLNQPIKSS